MVIISAIAIMFGSGPQRPTMLAMETPTNARIHSRSPIYVITRNSLFGNENTSVANVALVELVHGLVDGLLVHGEALDDRLDLVSGNSSVSICMNWACSKILTARRTQACGCGCSAKRRPSLGQ